ncbi:hypothetical protein [Limnofasciculus baicalensis]|uniref:Uncharacterized protein n=1 Tax=Limnofasciculus baicalensis BBK-W-15 TaxID=2699891 RepID=A0AAE3KKX5_9CYAN|nr:hypothetical protein [Limnofasciculus baicalensis]MCP2727036.1 hypothetical protein [Limnofasciculus baicalensis BBK-W-15]
MSGKRGWVICVKLIYKICDRISQRDRLHLASFQCPLCNLLNSIRLLTINVPATVDGSGTA